MDNANQNLDPSHENYVSHSSFDVTFYQVDNSVQSLKEKENISHLENPEDNSTDKLLSEKHSTLTIDSTDKENESPNNLSQIIQNETVTIGSSQFNIGEDTTMNK